MFARRHGTGPQYPRLGGRPKRIPQPLWLSFCVSLLSHVTHFHPYPHASVHSHSFSFLKNNFIHLFLAVLGLRCCVGIFLVSVNGGCSL